MSDTTTNTAGSELFGWEYERHGDEDYHLSYAAQQHLLVCRHFLQAL